jgi:DNA-binding response OmpR family regulator
MRRRVAVLDDDEDVLRLLAILLERAGFEAVTYAGRFDRLNFLVREQPDLVLLDVNMPGVGGDEFFELLRDDPRLAHVPVLFLSSNDEGELRRLVQRTGAAGYLAKGQFGRVFAARLERLLASFVAPAAQGAPA